MNINIKLAYEGKRLKVFRVTRTLNRPNTRMIMDNITSHIEVRVKVIYSFKLFKGNDCTAMGDWLHVYNLADVVTFIETFRQMAGQYYLDKIDVCKDAVNIPGISMTYVLNKSLEKNKGLELY